MAPWLAVAVCIAYPLVGLVLLWIVAEVVCRETADDAPGIIVFGFAVFWPLILVVAAGWYLADRFRGPDPPEA